MCASTLSSVRCSLRNPKRVQTSEICNFMCAREWAAGWSVWMFHRSSHWLTACSASDGNGTNGQSKLSTTKIFTSLRVQWVAVNVFFLHRLDSVVSNRWSRWWKKKLHTSLVFFMLALRIANVINSIYLQFRFANYTTLIILPYDIVRVFTYPLYEYVCGSCRKSEIWEHKITISHPSPNTAMSSNGPFRCGWLSIICHFPQYSNGF